jgi:anti-sigma B factor antagonist
MLEISNMQDVVVVALKDTDRLNDPVTEEVRGALLDLFNKPNMKVVFNLKGVSFIDSSGFGVFLSTLKAANNNYGEFKICNVSDEMMELFKLLQLHHVLEIYDQLDSCLSSFDK